MPSQSLEARVMMDVSSVSSSVTRMAREMEDATTKMTRSFNRLSSNIDKLVDKLGNNLAKQVTAMGSDIVKANQLASSSVDTTTVSVGNLAKKLQTVETEGVKAPQKLVKDFKAASAEIDKIFASMQKKSGVDEFTAKKAAKLTKMMVKEDVDPSIKGMSEFLEGQGVIMGTQNQKLVSMVTAGYQKIANVSKETADIEIKQRQRVVSEAAKQQKIFEQAVERTINIMRKEGSIDLKTSRRASSIVKQMGVEKVEPTFQGMTGFLEKEGLLTGAENQKLVTKISAIYPKISKEATAAYDEIAKKARVTADEQIKQAQRVEDANSKALKTPLPVMKQQPLDQRAQLLVSQAEAKGIKTEAEFIKFINPKPLGPDAGLKGLTPAQIAAIDLWRQKLGQVSLAEDALIRKQQELANANRVVPELSMFDLMRKKVDEMIAELGRMGMVDAKTMAQMRADAMKTIDSMDPLKKKITVTADELARLSAAAQFPSMVKGGGKGFRDMTKEEFEAARKSQIEYAKALEEQGAKLSPNFQIKADQFNAPPVYPKAPPNQLLLPSPEMVKAADAARLATKKTVDSIISDEERLRKLHMQQDPLGFKAAFASAKGAATDSFIRDTWARLSQGKPVLFSERKGSTESKIQEQFNKGLITSEAELAKYVKSMSTVPPAQAAVAKSTTDLNAKINQTPAAMSAASKEADKYAQQALRRAKEANITTMAGFEKMLGISAPGSQWEKFDQAAKAAFAKQLGGGATKPNFQKEFISQFIKEASAQGIKTIAEARQKLLQATGGAWTGLEDRTLLAFGKSIGITGNAYRKELDAMSKGTGKATGTMGIFWKEMREEMEMSARFALYRIPVIGRVLASTFRAGYQTLERNRRMREAEAPSAPPGAPPGGGGPDPSAVASGTTTGIAVLTKFIGISGLAVAAFTAIGAAAVAAGIYIAKRFADPVAQANENLENMGKVVNITAGALGALQGAAALQGESLEGLTRSLTVLNDKMQEAAQGNRVSREQLRLLGVEAVDPLTGKVKATLPALFDMADKLEAMGDTSARTNLVMNVFGSIMGSKIIKMLGEGSGKLKEYMATNIAFKNVLTDQEREISSKYLLAVRKFGLAWEGIKTQIGVAIQPILTKLFDKITNFIESPAFAKFMSITKNFLTTGIPIVSPGVAEVAELKQVNKEIERTQKAIDNLRKKAGDKPSTREAVEIEMLNKRLEDQTKRRDKLTEATKGMTSAVDDLINAQQDSDVAQDPAKTIAMGDAIFDANQQMKAQIVSLEAQEMALTKGAIAAKYYEEQQRHAADMAKARREERFGPDTEKFIAEETAVFNKRQAIARSMEEKLAKLQGTDWQTEVEKKNDSLNNSFRRLNDSIADTVTFVDPAKKAYQDYTRSIADLEVQTKDLLREARERAALNAKEPGLFPDAAKQVEGLERQLLKIRVMLKDPIQMRITFDEKLTNQMLLNRQQEIDLLKVESQAVDAISSEEKIRLEVERDILQLKKDGLQAEGAELDAVRQRLTLEERAKSTLQDQITIRRDQRQGRENIEDMIQQFKMDQAVTAEEKAQVAIQDKIIQMRRQNIDLLDGQHKADLQIYEDQARLKAQLDDMIQRYQQIAGEIEGSLHDALSGFGDAYTDILKKLGGDSSKTWKDIARDFFTTMRDAAMNVSKTLGKALIDQFMKSTTGATTDEWIKKIAGGLAGEAVGATPEQMLKMAAENMATKAAPAMVTAADKHMVAAAALTDAAAALKGSAVTTGPVPQTGTMRDAGGFLSPQAIQELVLTTRDDERRRIMIESISKQAEPLYNQGNYQIQANVGGRGYDSDTSIQDTMRELDQSLQTLDSSVSDSTDTMDKWMPKLDIFESPKMIGGPGMSYFVPPQEVSSSLTQDPRVSGWPEGVPLPPGYGGGMGGLEQMLPMIMSGVMGGKGGAGMAAAIVPMVLSYFMKMQKPIIMTMSDGVTKGVTKGMTEAKPIVETDITDMSKGMEDSFGTSISSIGTMFKDVFGGAFDYLKGLVDQAGTWLSDLFKDTTTSGDTQTDSGLSDILKSGVSMISKLLGGDKTIPTPEPRITPSATPPTPPMYNPKGIFWSGGKVVSGAELNAQEADLDKTLSDFGPKLNKVMDGSVDHLVDKMSDQVDDVAQPLSNALSGGLPDFFDEMDSGFKMSVTGFFDEFSGMADELGDMFQEVFSSDNLLKNFDLSNFDVSSITDQFGGNQGGGGQGFDMSGIGDMTDMFNISDMIDFGDFSDIFGDELMSGFESFMPDMSSMFGEGLTSILPDFFSSFSGGLGSITDMFGSGLTDMLGGIFGGAGGGGGIFGSLLSGVGSMFGGMGGMFGGAAAAGGEAAAGIGESVMSFLPMMLSFLEKGGTSEHLGGMSGIVTQPMSILHYAKGGIADLPGSDSSPVMTQIGEKAPSQLEAVVPLPDNRSIPVQITDKSLPYNPSSGGSSDGGMTPAAVAAMIPETPQPIVHVEMLGDMINPAPKGLTPEQSVNVWIEYARKDSAVRSAVKDIAGGRG